MENGLLFIFRYLMGGATDVFEIGLIYKLKHLTLFFTVLKSSDISVHVDVLMNIFRFH
jgi:hypothetical protein